MELKLKVNRLTRLLLNYSMIELRPRIKAFRQSTRSNRGLLAPKIFFILLHIIVLFEQNLIMVIII